MTPSSAQRDVVEVRPEHADRHGEEDDSDIEAEDADDFPLDGRWRDVSIAFGV